MKTAHIEEISSVGIKKEMLRIGAQSAEIIGIGHYDGDFNNPNSIVVFYKITNPQNGFDFIVADTNGDPVWQEEDYSSFSDLADSCGVEI